MVIWRYYNKKRNKTEDDHVFNINHRTKRYHVNVSPTEYYSDNGSYGWIGKIKEKLYELVVEYEKRGRK